MPNCNKKQNLEGEKSHMEKPAETQYAIHDLLKFRWSPSAFSTQPVEPEKLLSLFEAARWSPSGGNTQPWAFVVGTLDDKQTHDKFLETMTGRNPLWAKNAPVLVLAVAKLSPERPERNRYAYYALGQSVAHLTTQAGALGLRVHQLAGFSGEKARQAFDLPEDFDPVTIFAIGYEGDLNDLPEDLRERELLDRTRKPLTDFVFSGRWNQPLALSELASPASS
jgi:nitroreductase